MPASGPYPTAAAYLPAGRRSLAKLRAAAAGCRGCDLWEHATQTVFGAGPARARVLVGEQPGESEDLHGEPFVGPAGKLLDRALQAAGMERDTTYVTNAVKHFRWVLSGNRRSHQKPRITQVRACQPWLEAEVDVLEPDVIVALGSTAAQSLPGTSFRLTRERGRPLATGAWAPARVLATIHSWAVLRARDADRERAFGAFVRDLEQVGRALAR